MHLYTHNYWKCKAKQDWEGIKVGKIFDFECGNAATQKVIDQVQRQAQEEMVDSSPLVEV